MLRMRSPRCLVAIAAMQLSCAGPPPPAAPIALVIPEPVFECEPQAAPPTEPTSAPALTDAPTDIVGAWQGEVEEGDIDDGRYQVCMEVGPTKNSPNPIRYFGRLSCQGTARYSHSVGEARIFLEEIAAGGDAETADCESTGVIETRLNPGGSLDWRWFDTGASTPRATAQLWRRPSCILP